MTATHSSLCPQAVTSAQHMSSSAMRQLAGSGVMPPHLGTVTPHSVAQRFSAHTVAALFVHVSGLLFWAEVVLQHFCALQTSHADAPGPGSSMQPADPSPSIVPAS